MRYYENPKNGDHLSKLGFGLMRLPQDEKTAITLVRNAIDRGINYLDTAYIYPGNEVVLGKALRDGYREKVKVATKLPFYLCRKADDLERFFNTQLTRIGIDNVDYYLLHMLNSLSDWERLVSIGVIDWIKAKKDARQIINIGFSFHGTCKDFMKIIDAYSFDFCMIQYNYLDINHQAGQKGLHYAYEKGLPVFIMEPLRGGKLAANLPEKAIAAFKSANPALSPAQFALKWLFDQKEVAVVLSGMKTEDILTQNIQALESRELNSLERKAVEQAGLLISQTMRVPCTACGYCMPCPHGVDIPMCFSFYNDAVGKGYFPAKLNYIMRAADHEASLCVQCGLCEKHCPQHIAIRQCLSDVQKHMESFPYKPARFIIKKVLNRS